SQALEALVQEHAITDRQQQQRRHQGLDNQSGYVAHVASISLVVSSAFSNIASVVCGLRNGLATRIATRSPTRPIRPSVNVTSPQRTATRVSARISSGRVSPTSSDIRRRSGISASYSTASTAI